MMRLTILGTRGMIPKSAPRHRKHSGMLLDGALLFDCGEKAFLRHKPRAVFITHLHPDHAFFVEEPARLPPVPFFAPERKEFPFIAPAKALRVGPYRITPLPTEHSAKVRSCAYLVERGKKRVLYTGDMLWMQKKYRNRLGRLDCVVTEGSFLKEGGMIKKDPKSGRLYGHAGIPNLVRLFKPYTDTIVLTHFGSWFFENIPKSKRALALLAEKEGLRLVVAHDGMGLRL